ncbi:MAG: tRNA-guanine transglycosylase, partial [Rudaea sp.]
QHSKTRRPYQSLFGIVQGGAFQDLRADSAAFLSTLPFDGIAIGGSLGRSKADMHTILDWTISMLQEDKPRHLLGIGELEDIVECVERGIDLFDCAAPSRWARNGSFLVSSEQAREDGLEQGRLVIGNARFASDSRPVDARCGCPTCESYSRAYLHHLHRARELAYFRLATIHNLHFMMRFLTRVRGAIARGDWEQFRANPS